MGCEVLDRGGLAASWVREAVCVSGRSPRWLPDQSSFPLRKARPDMPPLDQRKQLAAARQAGNVAACGQPDGFGFTGLHKHANLGNDDFRKLLLNAVAWVSKLEVPAKGVLSKTLDRGDLEKLIDDGKLAVKKRGI